MFCHGENNAAISYEAFVIKIQSGKLILKSSVQIFMGFGYTIKC